MTNGSKDRPQRGLIEPEPLVRLFDALVKAPSKVHHAQTVKLLSSDRQSEP